MSALAEQPDRIRKIILTTEANTAGCYPVKLCVNGEFLTIVVDDNIPFDELPERDTWAFSRGTTESEIWV